MFARKLATNVFERVYIGNKSLADLKIVLVWTTKVLASLKGRRTLTTLSFVVSRQITLLTTKVG